MNRNKPYVSGPMTGLTDFNFQTFDSIEEALYRDGSEFVFSPANNDRETIKKVWGNDATPEQFPGYAVGDVGGYFDAVTSGGVFTLETMFQWDLDVITNRADSIVMAPGWEKSTGARYERIAAEALSKPIWFALPRAGDQGYKANPGDCPWKFVPDEEQKRLTTFLKQFGEPGLTGVCG